MLIVNEEHLHRAGVCSLDERYKFCTKAFGAYPLIMSDDADQTLYHAACAIQLATEIMIDVCTFFRLSAHMINCPFTQYPMLSLPHEEACMQSTNIRQIKAALWRQAFIGDTWVNCALGQVVAIRRKEGQLQAMIRG